MGRGAAFGRAHRPPVRPGQKRVSLTRSGGHKDDPLYAARRTLHTCADLLTEKQKARLAALFAVDEHVEVEVTWRIYQRMIAAYREPDREKGRDLMSKLIDSVSHGVLAALSEVTTLGRTLRKARCRRARLLRPARHIQRPHRGDQRQARTPAGLRPRIPQPHQLHRQIPARDRRLQTPTPPSIVKSRILGRPQASMRALYRRAALVAIWRRSKLTALGDPATTTGCAAPDRPVLRAPRMAPPHTSSRAERRLHAPEPGSGLITESDIELGRSYNPPCRIFASL